MAEKDQVKISQHLQIKWLLLPQHVNSVFSYNWEPADRHQWRGSHTGSEPEDRPDAQIATSTLHPQTKARKKRDRQDMR